MLQQQHQKLLQQQPEPCQFQLRMSLLQRQMPYLQQVLNPLLSHQHNLQLMRHQLHCLLRLYR
ncbi:MAG: hypothetical protein EBT64_08720 [Gammaproteobacteria bacterium]|nr:hypothetical protein [Gammaproteobacteria bacterium]